MLSTVSDIITETLVRNNRTTTDSFITDAMLQDWTRMAHDYCSAKYKWPLAEQRDQSVAFLGTEEIPYSSFTVKFKADSIRFLQIDGKRIQKIDFQEYQKFREDYPSDNERYYSDFSRTLFINPNMGISGTITAFGQYLPLLDPTDLAATTIFSTFDQEGNEAIVEKMTSYLKAREHLPDEKQFHEQLADQKLIDLWTKIQEDQYKYQTGRNSEGIFTRLDVVYGDYNDSLFRRDQF